MQTDRIVHGTWILVSDGRKALVLLQEGDHDRPNLSVRAVFEAPDNPRTSAQGSDRPTLTRPAGGAGGTATAQTDWHDLAEQDFARATLTGLTRILQEAGEAHRLVVAAPPRTLHVLRQAMSPQLKSLVVAEHAHDYVRHPVPEIERLLTKG